MPKVRHWCAGWNQGSYSSDPASVMHGGTLEEAFAHLQSQLEHERDYAATDEDEQKFIDAIDELTQLDQREVELQAARSYWEAGTTVVVNGWEYWVMACYKVACDQIEEE